MRPDPNADTIETIEGIVWPAPEPDDTRLIREVHRLRTVPLPELDAEAYRVLLGQHEAVEVVVPLALTALADDPLLEGDFYPGDVLTAALKLDEYWPDHPAERAAMLRVLAAVDRSQLEDPDDLDLVELIEGFLARWS